MYEFEFVSGNINFFFVETMDKLLIFASLIILSNGGLVRVPKIYNALISSDENLSPSHAVPVVEPVLRTTALGVAFPPILVHSTLEELPKESGNNNNAKVKIKRPQYLSLFKRIDEVA